MRSQDVRQMEDSHVALPAIQALAKKLRAQRELSVEIHLQMGELAREAMGGHYGNKEIESLAEELTVHSGSDMSEATLYKAGRVVSVFDAAELREASEAGVAWWEIIEVVSKKEKKKNPHTVLNDLIRERRKRREERLQTISGARRKAPIRRGTSRPRIAR